MQEVYGIFHRSIRDLVRWEVLREVLVTGIPMLFIWMGIGWVFWDELLKWSTWLINWVPFSIVKANGAMLVLFLLWALAVLVSYAFLTAIIAPLVFRKMKKGYYYYSFTTLLGFAILWGWLMMLNWGVLEKWIANKLLVWLPFQTVAEGSAVLLNVYVFYSFYVLSLFLVLSLYRKEFLETIREIEYPDVEIATERVKAMHFPVALRDSLLFIVLTVLFFPLLMIPIVNVLIQLFLWAWLYRDANFRATCQLYCSKEEYERMRRHRAVIWSIAFFASLLNFVPIINIFTPFFAQLIVFHWIMQEKGVGTGNQERTTKTAKENE